MPSDAFTVLLTPSQIQHRVHELASEIDAAYAAHEVLHLVSVLKGGFIFLADLSRALRHPLTIDFMAVKRYGSETESSRDIRLTKDLDASMEGRDVVLVEDIIDTGRTVSWVQRYLRARGPRTLRTVCLLDKPARRQVDVAIDHVGFTIENRFVIGYGLDYGERYRELPYVAALDAF